MSLSQRVKKIEPSPTLGLVAVAKNLKAQGHDVIEFGAGEPDFNTPDNIKAAGIKAIEDNFTRYTPNLGIKELRDAICEKLEKENNLKYTPDQVIVSSGAKHSLFNAIMALCDVGDEVIIPAPYWVTYPELVKMADGIPVTITTTGETGYKMTARQLQAAVTPKSKIVIINSPSNPTGAVYTEAELREIAQVCVENNIYVISDEIYEKLIYDDEKHVSIASFGEDIKKLTVTINGVSKAYAMTGWRIGYAAGGNEIIEAMDAFQSHATSAPASMTQKASYEAIAGNQDAVEEMRKEFDKRRKFIVDELNKIPGITCQIPKGAFYAFPDISGLYGKTIGGVTIEDDNVFAKLLLEKVYVAVVPGSPFGSPGNIRLSYANSIEYMKKGLDRINDLVAGNI
ncbi:pyridoxal phosphate-dependent aminotransferase [Desulfitibacter alkalitolerans]|uniref:pyridoxal phosphate-dependent aminotransferase n=1 Tax=Desulfitibacter alkalitolerans TaxID=264641 RepID=UPI0004844EDA|nr:pyridoxal phosphate-dependent aminotransferase [Desulfitibacter alkalitolerans]